MQNSKMAVDFSFPTNITNRKLRWMIGYLPCTWETVPEQAWQLAADVYLKEGVQPQTCPRREPPRAPPSVPCKKSPDSPKLALQTLPHLSYP